MKHTKHIRQDFHFVTWVMPQGWTGALKGQFRRKHIRQDFDFFTSIMPHGWTGALGCLRGQKKFFKDGHVAYQIDRDDEPNRMQVS